jgi:hypothetical protein
MRAQPYFGRLRMEKLSRFIMLVSVAGLLGASGAEEKHSFVLSPTLGSALLKQCSRPTPQNIEGFWVPTEQNIARLEQLLVPFLTSISGGKSALPLEHYHRQYVGFIKGGKRYIYGNFYGQSEAGRNESVEPVIVCDGGADFWGIVYSLDSNTFSNFYRNGFA